MSRFQQGSLLKLKRRSCPDVWVFRWYENTSGKRRYKKQIIGSVVEMRTRWEAEKAVTLLRSSVNAEVGRPKLVSDLVAHYRLHELTREEKLFQQSKVIEFYSSVISNLAGHTFYSVRFEPCRSRNGCILLRWPRVQKQSSRAFYRRCITTQSAMSGSLSIPSIG